MGRIDIEAKAWARVGISSRAGLSIGISSVYEFGKVFALGLRVEARDRDGAAIALAVAGQPSPRAIFLGGILVVGTMEAAALCPEVAVGID